MGTRGVSTSSRRVLVGICGTLLVLFSSSAGAGWFSWLGGVLTKMAAAAFLFSPPVAGALGGAQVAAIVLDKVVDEIHQVFPNFIPDPLPPPAQRPPPTMPPPVIPPPADAPVSMLTFPPLTSTTPNSVALVNATNMMLAALNALSTDVRHGSPLEVISGDVVALSNGFAFMADEMQPFNFSVTQQDLDAFSGLPAFEVAYLTQAGFSSTEIQGFENYVLGIDTNISAPSVDAVTVLREVAADIRLVPEPTSLLLFSIGLFVLVGHGCRCQRRVQSKAIHTVS